MNLTCVRHPKGSDVKTDVLIIGAGLSGLRLAKGLAEAAIDFHLVEARGRVGGRILSKTVEGAAYDLGPAWFWPGQPRMAALVRAHGLRMFDQHSQGELTFEDEHGQVQRGRGWASMEGSYRLDGGFGVLTERLAGDLPAGHLSLNRAVTKLALMDGAVTVTTAQGPITARRVVLALPPRIAATLAFEPTLPAGAIAAMQGVSTWMAGQAKAVAVYDRPFWRDAGLSGDAMSRHGPMAEIHDASPADGGQAALFGFVGVAPAARRDEAALRQAVIMQLARLFGGQAAHPRAVMVKDWAADALTATLRDQAPLSAHPRYGLPHVLRGLWDGRLILAGTETAPQYGGYLEGALEAAENAFEALQTTDSPQQV